VGSSGIAREHVEVTIRDADGKVLGPDREGEICVGPAPEGVFAGCYSTMLGYWNQPDRTEETLRQGVLHTGDVGRLDADGVLWVLDRRSDLIIRGGANVYPAEVERVVEEMSEIAEVAVVPRQHERLGEEVIGIIIAAHGIDVADLDERKLIEACCARLAKYKVPLEWYGVEQFPRNAMGKVVKPVLRRWLDDCVWPEEFSAPQRIE
jgi:acyl-CoA synthetase (AMP-forming)/AMP-acid ligase II